MRRFIHFPFWPLEPYSNGWHHLRTGIWGEHAVARSLWLSGHRILAHRWKTSRRSDIDLIVATRDQILFCEVKVRTNDGDLVWLKVIEEKRLENLCLAAGEYLRATRQTRVNIRFKAFLVRPDIAMPRHPSIEVLSDYLNPNTVPGWKGVLSSPNPSTGIQFGAV